MPKKNEKPAKVSKKIGVSDVSIKINKGRWLPIVAFPSNDTSMKAPLIALISISFFSVFVLYLTHLMPFIPGGDSGELITSAYLLGIPHPPGYPLFNLVGKLFTLIPINTIAWRVNLSSAVLHLGASFFIYLSVYRLVKFWPAALLASLFYSFFPLIWEYSLRAEVFPLNNLLASIILFLIVLSRESYLHYQSGVLDKNCYERKSRLMLYWTLFTCGLALTNHHTIILLAPGVLLSLYFYNRTVLFKGPTLFIALAAFVLGLMVYLYIPVRAHAQPFLNWDNAQTIKGFINLVTRSDYGSFNLQNTEADVFSIDEKYLSYLSHLINQIGLLGLIMTLFGLVFLFRQKDKKLGYVFIVLYFFSSFFFITLANVPRNTEIFAGVLERFYMLPLVFIALFIGLGIYFLYQMLFLYFEAKKGRAILGGLVLLLALISSLLPFKDLKSPTRVIHAFGYNILNSVEKNAVVLAGSDTSVNVLGYLQQIEHVRPDVVLLASNLLYASWYVEQMKKMYPDVTIPFLKMDNDFNTLAQFVDANLEKRPIYMVGIMHDLPEFDSSYQFINTGIVTKIVKTNLNLSAHLNFVEALWKSYDLSDLTRPFSSTTFEKETVSIYASAHFRLGVIYLQLGLDDLSIREFKKALELNEVGLNSAYKNIGLIYSDRKHDPKNAIVNFRAFIRFNPRDEGNKGLIKYIKKNSQMA